MRVRAGSRAERALAMNAAVVIALALVIAGAIYIRQRWRRAPQVYRGDNRAESQRVTFVDWVARVRDRLSSLCSPQQPRKRAHRDRPTRFETAEKSGRQVGGAHVLTYAVAGIGIGRAAAIGAHRSIGVLHLRPGKVLRKSISISKGVCNPSSLRNGQRYVPMILPCPVAGKAICRLNLRYAL